MVSGTNLSGVCVRVRSDGLPSWVCRLKDRMDEFVDGMWRHSSMMAASQGRMDPVSSLRYLETIRYLIKYTPICLGRAAERCVEEVGLRQVFLDKLKEEEGHEAWVERDIHLLRERFGLREEVPVLTGADKLAGAFCEAIEEEPVAYLVYAVTTEYITVRLAPTTVQLLHERCGIPKEALSVLSLHAEADVAHVEEGFEALGSLPVDPESQRIAALYLERYLAHYRTIFDSLAQAAQPVTS